MQNDDVPIKQCRRRSIFDDGKEQPTSAFQTNFPEEKIEIYYPIEYIENVRTEIEQWKMYIVKTLEEKLKFRDEKMKLQTTVLDESVLSPKQQEFFASLNFNTYMRRVEMFCNRGMIVAHKIQYELANETENRYLVAQSKIEKEILNKHFK